MEHRPAIGRIKAFLRAMAEASEKPKQRAGTAPTFQSGPGRKSLWTVWRPIIRGSRYSPRDVKRLGGKRGVGRPPAILAARRQQELEELAA